MKVNKIEYKQKIYNHSIDDVFSFFSKPENLSKITPSRLGFYIKTPSPIVMKSGQLIDYIIKIVGLPVHWRTLITEYQSPHLFVDQQIKGPYSLWHHKHLFKEIENGVEICDIIHYSVPLGFIGSIVNTLWIKKDLDSIFKYRYQVINDIFKQEES